MSTHEIKSEEIQAEIRKTRSDMDETIDRLGNVLHPSFFIDRFLDRVREADTEEIMGAVKQGASHGLNHLQRHPISSLIFGAGLGMLAYEVSLSEEKKLDSDGLADRGKAAWSRTKAGAKSQARATREGLSEAAKSARESITQAGHTAGDRVKAAGKRTSQRTSGLKPDVKNRYQQGLDQMERVSRSHPLAIGAGVLVVGGVIGYLLPGSRKEDRWMGEYSDDLEREARDRAEDVAERAKEVAQAAAEAAKDQAKREGLSKEALQEKVRNVGEQAKSTTKEEICKDKP